MAPDNDFNSFEMLKSFDVDCESTFENRFVKNESAIRVSRADIRLTGYRPIHKTNIVWEVSFLRNYIIVAPMLKGSCFKKYT